MGIMLPVALSHQTLGCLLSASLAYCLFSFCLSLFSGTPSSVIISSPQLSVSWLSHIFFLPPFSCPVSVHAVILSTLFLSITIFFSRHDYHVCSPPFFPLFFFSSLPGLDLPLPTAYLFTVFCLPLCPFFSAFPLCWYYGNCPLSHCYRTILYNV